MLAPMSNTTAPSRSTTPPCRQDSPTKISSCRNLVSAGEISASAPRSASPDGSTRATPPSTRACPVSRSRSQDELCHAALTIGLHVADAGDQVRVSGGSAATDTVGVSERSADDHGDNGGRGNAERERLLAGIFAATLGHTGPLSPRSRHRRTPGCPRSARTVSTSSRTSRTCQAPAPGPNGRQHLSGTREERAYRRKVTKGLLWTVRAPGARDSPHVWPRTSWAPLR
ncbi:hypothetical protein H4W33_007287 [Kibdelosporangium phytohabitans]|nr:hypothetical protein [Kibdelosporangium phytohabitans]